MATPVRVNEDNYVRLESEARKERRSVTSQLNVILDGRYGRNTVGVPPKNTPQSRKDDINDLFNAPTPEKNKIEAEKQSDRDQVARYLPLLQNLTIKERQAELAQTVLAGMPELTPKQQEFVESRLQELEKTFKENNQ